MEDGRVSVLASCPFGAEYVGVLLEGERDC